MLPSSLSLLCFVRHQNGSDAKQNQTNLQLEIFPSSHVPNSARRTLVTPTVISVCMPDLRLCCQIGSLETGLELFWFVRHQNGSVAKHNHTTLLLLKIDEAHISLSSGFFNKQSSTLSAYPSCPPFTSRGSVLGNTIVSGGRGVFGTILEDNELEMCVCEKVRKK